jgi:hypothetical protein
VCSKYEKVSTDVYFGFLLVQDEKTWHPLTEFVGAKTPDLDSFRDAKSAEREQVEPGEDDFTRLDELLIPAIVASAAASDGALDRDRTDDLIDEVVELNALRHKSLFHRGFADVIFGHELALHGPAENENRRRWYLCGAIVACARRADYARIAQLHDSEDDVRAFGQEAKPRSRKAAQFVFEALCRQDRASAAAAFLSPSMVIDAGLFHLVLHWGTRFLRLQQIDNAYALFELLNRSLNRTSEEVRAELGDAVYVLQRRTAHCLRMKGQFGAARKILEGLLQDPSAPERSAMLSDIAIMSVGFRGLMDIVIPEKDVSSFIEKLERIRPNLEEARKERANRGHAEYCLGVLLVANHKDAEKAADLLEPSVSNMVSRGAAYDLSGLLSRSQFYLGLSLAETLNQGHVSRAGDLFTKAIESGFTPPAQLLKRFLEALLLTSADVARTASETAAQKLKVGKQVLHSLLESELVSDSEPLLNALLDWARDNSRPGKQRFNDLGKVLAHALRGNKVQVAEKALDEMELLARSGICSREFVTLLGNSDNFDPAWSVSDATWAIVGVLEHLGEYREATTELRKEFHAQIVSRKVGAQSEAEDILDRVRGYGLPEIEYQDLERRFQAALVDDNETIVGHSEDAPVCITVVGGDEMQARYDKELMEELKADLDPLELHFRHTNWSSNFGDQFDQMRPLLDRSHAVVVMRRIRTNLGRTIRRSCPSWIGCAGDSKSSISRAVRKAVSMARRNSQQAPDVE